MPGFKREDIYPDFYKKDPPIPESTLLFYKFEALGTPFITTQGSRFLRSRWGDRGTQTTPLSSPAIRDLIVNQFVAEHHRLPRDSSLRSAFRAFQAKSANDWQDIHHRFGWHQGNIHIDPVWRAPNFTGKHIEVSPAGWSARVNCLCTLTPAAAAEHPTVDPHQHSTPDPLAALEPLRQLLHLENDRPAWLRVLVWLLAAFRPAASPADPRDLPILHLSGPASSGKTPAARMLRDLVDPSNAPITVTPATESAAGRIARDNHVVFIDGIARLARRPAEVLARLSTGLPAKLYGDSQNVSRPIVLTTNEPEATTRLTHRLLPIELPPLASPLPPEEVRRQFEAHRPTLVAALLTLLSTALRRLPDTPAPENARFPEAVQWAIAALETLDPKELVRVTHPQDPLEGGLTSLIAAAGSEWQGTASEPTASLKTALCPRALSQKVKRISAVCVTARRSGRRRTLTLRLPAGVHSPRLRLSSLATVSPHLYPYRHRVSSTGEPSDPLPSSTHRCRPPCSGIPLNPVPATTPRPSGCARHGGRKRSAAGATLPGAQIAEVPLSWGSVWLPESGRSGVLAVPGHRLTTILRRHPRGALLR